MPPLRSLRRGREPHRTRLARVRNRPVRALAKRRTDRQGRNRTCPRARVRACARIGLRLRRRFSEGRPARATRRCVRTHRRTVAIRENSHRSACRPSTRERSPLRRRERFERSRARHRLWRRRLHLRARQCSARALPRDALGLGDTASIPQRRDRHSRSRGRAPCEAIRIPARAPSLHRAAFQASRGALRRIHVERGQRHRSRNGARELVRFETCGRVRSTQRSPQLR